MAEALHGRPWVHHVTGPHTMRLLMEFIGLCNTLEQVQLSPVVPDTYAETYGQSAVLGIIGI
jgi:hypothetical protein